MKNLPVIVLENEQEIQQQNSIKEEPMTDDNDEYSPNMLDTEIVDVDQSILAVNEIRKECNDSSQEETLHSRIKTDSLGNNQNMFVKRHQGPLKGHPKPSEVNCRLNSKSYTVNASTKQRNLHHQESQSNLLESSQIPNTYLQSPISEFNQLKCQLRSLSFPHSSHQYEKVYQVKHQMIGNKTKENHILTSSPEQNNTQVEWKLFLPATAANCE